MPSHTVLWQCRSHLKPQITVCYEQPLYGNSPVSPCGPVLYESTGIQRFVNKAPKTHDLALHPLVRNTLFFGGSIFLLHTCPCSYFKHTALQSMVGEDHSTSVTPCEHTAHWHNAIWSHWWLRWVYPANQPHVTPSSELPLSTACPRSIEGQDLLQHVLGRYIHDPHPSHCPSRDLYSDLSMAASSHSPGNPVSV